MSTLGPLVVRPALESPTLTICSRQKTYECQLKPLSRVHYYR